MRYVAAFRTYTWDEDVRALAGRFFGACKSARKVVLADETRGYLPVNGYPVLSHTEDTAELGLPVHPARNSLWFNVDYGFYILRQSLRDYPYYLFSESDLAVNLDLEPMVQAAAAGGIDFIAHDVKLSTPDWYWHGSATAVFDHPWRSLLCFTLLSERAIDVLLAERRRLAAELQAGRLAAWPFCEFFVPTVLHAAGMRFAELSAFADTGHLNFRPRIPLDDPRANQPGTLVHSVLPRPALLKDALRANEPRDWFLPDGKLRTALRDFRFEDYADLLRAEFERRRDHAGLVKFKEHMAMEGMALPPDDDLARCKPSLTSSTSPWSHFPEPQRDAGGANGADLPGQYGFHTQQEDNPWWMVDLMDEFIVDEVVLVNRPKLTGRFVHFTIDSSRDSNAWLVRHTKLDANEVSADADNPHRIGFSDPFVARYVRVRLIGKGFLHLRRVQVFGRRVLARPAAVS